jgi:hypothetical protein
MAFGFHEKGRLEIIAGGAFVRKWPNPKYTIHIEVDRGCQMVYFQTKNPTLGKFCRVLQWKMMVSLYPFRRVYGHFVYYMAICFF